ncbi:MAG TPA: GspH/FimT family pseudopilin [Candidatus Angelobacter sp.]|nr:GspH/FimT family pseudopilin [Candidatus Angelobacter sp.]
MQKTAIQRDQVLQDGFVIPPASASARGYSLLELVVTVAVILITTAIALPLVQNASRSYQMRSAVVSVTGAIQSARYQAISRGYPFRLALTAAGSTYQIWNSTCGSAAPCWAKVGGVVPLSGSGVSAVLSADTSLDFSPSGAVVASTGALNFSLTYKGAVESITVSNYGNVTVSP